MNVSNAASAITAAMMAFNTKAAGPSRHNFSKADAIAQSNIKVRATLRAPLIRARVTYKLALSPMPAQTAAVGLRGKASDLVHTPEIFCARSKKDVAIDVRRAPGAQGKGQADEPGRAPLRADAGKRAARSNCIQREGPIAREIHRAAAIQRQNASSRVPIPMRSEEHT